MNKQRAELLLLFAAIIGGSGFVSMKYLLEWGFAPFQIIAIRFLIGGGLLFLIYHKVMKGVTKQEWKAGIFLGILLYILFAFLTIGLKFTTPSVSAFLGNSQAIMAPFLCWMIYKKRPDVCCFFAAILTIVGVGLLSVGSDFKIGIGAILSLLSSLAFALQMTFLETIAKTGNPTRLAIIEHLTVAVLAMATSFSIEGDLTHFSAASIFHFLLLGIFCTGVYFLLQCIGQIYTTASNTAVIITCESVFGAIGAALFYGERMPFQAYIGCALIFFAVIVAVKKPVIRFSHYSVDEK